MPNFSDYDLWKLREPDHYDTSEQEAAEEAHYEAQFMAWAEQQIAEAV